MSDQTSRTDILISDEEKESELDFTGYFEDGEKGDENAEDADTHKVKYNGKEMDMSLEELIIAAQKGLNYDKVKAQRDALAHENDDLDVLALIDEYPELDPESVPREVFESADERGGILNSYRDYLLKGRGEELLALKKELENLKKAPGGVSTDFDGSNDPFLTGLFGK